MSERDLQSGRYGDGRRVDNGWLPQVHASLGKPVSDIEVTDDDRVAAIRSVVLRIVTTILVALQRYCPHRAEDITQDVMVKLLRFDTMRQFDPRMGTLQQWLWGMIRWTVVADLRRDRRSRDVPVEGLDRLPGAGPSPAQRAEQVELAELIPTWLGELTDKRRGAVQRAFFLQAGEAGSEVAEGVSERVNRSRGLRDLRRIVEERT